MSNPTNPIDLDRLHQISRGDKDLQVEFLQIFIEETEIHLEQLKLAISVNDLIDAIAQAHAIKGASSNLGVPLMQAAAAQIESQARSLQQAPNSTPASWEGLADLIAQLEQTFEAVKTLTRNYQSDPP